MITFILDEVPHDVRVPACEIAADGIFGPRLLSGPRPSLAEGCSAVSPGRPFGQIFPIHQTARQDDR